MSIKPLGNRILVQRKQVEEKTKGGIYIPDTAKEKTQEGVVKAVAEDNKSVKVGDKVLFESYAGSDIKVEGQDYLIMDMKDVLAVLE